MTQKLQMARKNVERILLSVMTMDGKRVKRKWELAKVQKAVQLHLTCAGYLAEKSN